MRIQNEITMEKNKLEIKLKSGEDKKVGSNNDPF